MKKKIIYLSPTIAENVIVPITEKEGTFTFAGVQIKAQILGKHKGHDLIYVELLDLLSKRR